MTTLETPVTADGTRALAQPMAVAVAADGTTMHVLSGPVDAEYPRRWFLQMEVPGSGHPMRVEWDRGANFASAEGVRIDIVLGSLRTTALCKNGQAALASDAPADVRAELAAVGTQILRFDPRTWPVQPPRPGDLVPAVDSAGEFLDCVAEVAEAGGVVGALGGFIAGSAAAGVGGGTGALVGGLAGGALAGAGGAIGCGIGWAVHG